MSAPCPHHPHPCEDLRLEGITTCVGFDDILDITLSENHGQLDHMIVVGEGHDHKVIKCCRKHNATFVESHLFRKNGRRFNKGAAINQGFGHFQYHGWRLALDSDIMLPADFRRMLFNHTHLDKKGLYHADRVDLIGWDEIDAVINYHMPQNHHNVVQPHHHRPVRERYVDKLYGFIPVGFFQLFNASHQRPYPFSLGTAAHDDVLFAAQWAPEDRHMLPSAFVYHICGSQPQYMENWNGDRKQRRLDKDAK